MMIKSGESPISIMDVLKASRLAKADFKCGGPATKAMRVCRRAARCCTAWRIPL